MRPLKELNMLCFLYGKPLEYLHSEVVSQDLSPPSSCILKKINSTWLNIFNDKLRTPGWKHRGYSAQFSSKFCEGHVVIQVNSVFYCVK